MPHLIGFAAALVWISQAGAASTAADLVQQGEHELYAARYQTAAERYREALKADPAGSGAYYGLVRALIADHRSREAYTAADEALRANPQTAATQTAAGLASFRRGDLTKAEEYLRAALKLDSGFAGALQGLASISSAVSRFKTSRDLLLAAYRRWPEDPDLIIAYANTLKGTEHVSTLQRALAILDPDAEQSRTLRAHIASDLAIGQRRVREVVSPYVTTKVKLSVIMDGPKRWKGVGLRVQLNGRQSVRLMLDTGASGIGVSPKAADRAGLERLGEESSDAKGIGDERAQSSYRYLASELQIGDIVWSNYPVSVFRSAKTADFDGLIGADVFQAFLVTVDFPKFELVLTPRPGAGDAANSGGPTDAGPPAPGFHRLFRFGNHLAVPTFINDGPATLFLLDSGASANFLDSTIGAESTRVYRDETAIVKGIQGSVKQTSRADNATLTFAGFRQNNPSLVAISLEKMSDSMGVAFAGILGMPVLGQLRVTIDYHEGTIQLEHGR